MRGHGGAVGHVEAAHPLDVGVALPARQQQAHGVALLGANGLAVLRVDDHGVVQQFGERHAAGELAGVGALGDHPFGRGLELRFSEQELHGHTGPLAATGEAVALLRIGGEIARVFRAPVAGALDEVQAGGGWEVFEVVERVDEGLLDQAVDQQFMSGRIDVGDAGVVPLKVQRGGRDDAVGVL